MHEDLSAEFEELMLENDRLKKLVEAYEQKMTVSNTKMADAWEKKLEMKLKTQEEELRTYYDR